MYHITMVAKTVTAINYEHRNGSTPVGFTGTPLLPLAKGQATVSSKQGSITINSSFKNMQPAQNFGKEYLTYVLWAITPEGKATNLGEVQLNGTNSKLYATTPLQSFGMIVTAEPYFAVNQPSDVVVLENTILPETRGTFQPITANYSLLQRGQYTYDMTKMGDAVTLNPKTPLEVYEARNAVQIAINSGAQQYAPDALAKAQKLARQRRIARQEQGQQEVHHPVRARCRANRRRCPRHFREARQRREDRLRTSRCPPLPPPLLRLSNSRKPPLARKRKWIACAPNATPLSNPRTPRSPRRRATIRRCRRSCASERKGSAGCRREI